MINSETAFTVPVMTIEDFILMRREEGARILEFKGVAWQEYPFGFLTPAHLLQRLPFDCPVPKTIYRWGWRHCIDNNTEASSYFIPAHLLTEPSQYSEANLPSNDRRKLNKARRSTTVIPLEDFTVIEREGYDVYAAACIRTKQVLMSRTKYLAYMSWFINSSRRLVLGAFVEGKLAGYISAYAVESTVYGEKVWISDLGRKYDVNRLLVYEIIRAAGRASGIKEIFGGQHSRKSPEITKFKLNMGFPVVRVPIKAYIPKAPRWIGSKLFPQKLYRLIGG
ncbi:hypothetical protein IQ238_10960 [Pleurocapsales cyanobacterium LEGE 06147]|nr:hypothetical protein [Pleurocapsales cyanobacterium LEGE 06147]